MAKKERIPTEDEGIIRRRREGDKVIPNQQTQSTYILEYNGETFLPNEFIERYCPEYKKNMFGNMMIRCKTPAEIIVKYNALHKPIHEHEGLLYTETLKAQTTKNDRIRSNRANLPLRKQKRRQRKLIL